MNKKKIKKYINKIFKKRNIKKKIIKIKSLLNFTQIKKIKSKKK